MNDASLTLRTVDAVDVQLELAGAGSRAYAFIVDWHIRLLAALLWMVSAGWATGVLFGDDGGYGQWQLALTWLPTAAIYFLYHPLLETAMRGRTPGKRWAGIRIVAVDGTTAGVGAILLRNLFRLIDSLPVTYALGLTLLLCTREQVRIGDMAAGTRVIHEHAGGRKGIADAAFYSERLPPQLLGLLEEWLARWSQIDSGQRDALAQRLLSKAPDAGLAESARTLTGSALRDHVRKLIADVKAGA